MKKILFALILFMFFTSYVSATSTKNGVPITPSNDINNKEVTVTCRYKSGHEIILHREDKNDTDGECNGAEDSETCQRNGGFISKMDSYLSGKGFMYDNIYFDCPKYAIWALDEQGEVYIADYTNNPNTNNIFELNSEASTCVGACQGEQYRNNNNNNNNKEWTCDYNGPSGKIQTKFDGLYWFIDQNQILNEVDNGEDIDENCGDIFFNPHYATSFFKIANYNISNLEDLSQLQEWYELICNDETLIGEYYCSGNCKYPENKNISCKAIKEKLNSKINGPKIEMDLSEMCSDNNVKKALRLIGILFLIIKIVIPLILIIMGTIEFGKAMLSSDGDAISKAIKKMITRVIASVAIFLIPTIVRFVFELIPISTSFEECGICVLNPNSCEINEE